MLIINGRPGYPLPFETMRVVRVNRKSHPFHLESQLHLFGPADVERFKRDAETRANLMGNLRGLHRVLIERAYAVERVLSMMEHGLQLPDVAQAMGLPPATPRITKSLLWTIREGSNAALAVDLLKAAGRAGMTEDELVAALQAQGRMTSAKHPRRAMHWTLTNINKRTGGAIQVRKNGKWVYLRPIWRKPDAPA